MPTCAPSGGFSSICLHSEGATWFFRATSNLSLRFLVLCSHFRNPSGIRFLTSFHVGQWYNLCFSAPSSVLQSRHSFSSDQPVSYNLFCTHPPSTTSFLITCRCLSVHASLVSLRSIASIGSSRTPSCSSPHSCFAAYLSRQKHLFHVLRADHSHVHRHLLLKQPGVPMWPFDAKIASLALDCRCKASHLSPRLYFKDLLPPSLLLLSFHFPSQTPSAQASVAMVESSSSTSRLFTSI